MHGHILNDILQIFETQKLSISDFILTALSKEKEQILQPAFEGLILDLLSNVDRVLDAFASHPRAQKNVVKWVHEKAKGIYAEESHRMTRTDAGFHFNAVKAQAHQILGFNANALVLRVAHDMPYLWDLLRSLTRQDEPTFILSDTDDSIRARDVVSNTMLCDLELMADNVSRNHSCASEAFSMGSIEHAIYSRQ